MCCLNLLFLSHCFILWVESRNTLMWVMCKLCGPVCDSSMCLCSSRIVQASGCVQAEVCFREEGVSWWCQRERGWIGAWQNACSENTWGGKSGADRRRNKVCVCVDSKAREDLITKKQDLWASIILVRLDTTLLSLVSFGSDTESRLSFWSF